MIVPPIIGGAGATRESAPQSVWPPGPNFLDPPLLFHVSQITFSSPKPQTIITTSAAAAADTKRGKKFSRQELFKLWKWGKFSVETTKTKMAATENTTFSWFRLIQFLQGKCYNTQPSKKAKVQSFCNQWSWLFISPDSGARLPWDGFNFKSKAMFNWSCQIRLLLSCWWIC